MANLGGQRFVLTFGQPVWCLGQTLPCTGCSRSPLRFARRASRLLAPILLVAVSAMADATPAGSGTDLHPKVWPAPYGPWPDAWWLSNGQVEAVFVPAINRIMRFAEPGGPNALWIDTEAEKGPAMPWKNWGGEKIWFWPQERWDALGGDWPPPMDPGRPASVVATADGLAISIPDANGVPEILRSIRLPPNSRELHVTTQWSDPSKADGFSLWSIAQIPASDGVKVSKLRDAKGWSWMQGTRAAEPRSEADGWFWATIDNKAGKCGFAANALEGATPAGRLLMESRSRAATPTADWKQTGAQVYFDHPEPKQRPAHLPRYTELEFIAPSPGSPLEQVWTLR